MYLSAFGLNSKPFSIAPDVEQIIWTDAARAVRNRVKAAIDKQVPTLALIGDVGSGKTTLILSLLQEGFAAGTQVVFLRSFVDSPDALLKMVADQVSEAAGPDTSAMRIASAALFAPLVVILDEAQGAAPDAVCELDRIARDTGRMTLLLVGQPELGLRLRGPEYHALEIPSDYRLSMPLPTEEEAQAYLSGRLIAAGGSPHLIAPGAAVLIARAARRVPRLMNKVADACLFLAACEGRSDVDATFAAQVIQHDLDPVSLAMSPRNFAGIPKRAQSSQDADLAKAPNNALPANKNKSPSIKMDREAKTEKSAPPIRSAMGVAAAVVIIPAVIAVLLLRPGPYPTSISNLDERSEILADPQDQAPTDGLEIPVGDSAGVISKGPAQMDPAVASADVVTALFQKALAEDDPRKSAIDYSRAASLGHDRSARYIAQKFQTGDGVIFSADMAERWFAAANGADPAAITITGNPAQVFPLLGIRTEGRIDLVWDGSADTFVVDLADADLTIFGQITTPLTAVSLSGSPDAENWRVRADGADTADWIPLVN